MNLKDCELHYRKVHVEDGPHIHYLEIGPDQVVIDKLYGPTIFADLRITADIKRGWVIERKNIRTNEWEEQTVIDATRDEEFDE